MFSHVMLGSKDIEKSKAFYDATLSVLGYGEGIINGKGSCMYMSKSGTFGFTKPVNGEEATHGNGSTVGFAAQSPEMIDKWHQAGIENGGITCEDPPGIRDMGNMKIYLAYLRDPSGNKICGCHILP